MSVAGLRAVRADLDALALVHRTLLGEAVDESSLLVFVADEDMRYAAVNARVCEVLGYSRKEMQQLSVSDVATELSAPADYAEMVTKGQRSGTAGLLTKAGERLHYTYHASETAVSGVRFYVAVGIVREATAVGTELS
jgi:PAS domain S-box-containing protein